MFVLSSSTFHLSSRPRFWTLPATCPPAAKLQGGNSNTWEAAGEAGEIHATLGTGDNENESRENESISTPSTGPLTLHKHPTYTRGKWPGFINKHLCWHILSMCKENPCPLLTLQATIVFCSNSRQHNHKEALLSRIMSKEKISECSEHWCDFLRNLKTIWILTGLEPYIYMDSMVVNGEFITVFNKLQLIGAQYWAFWDSNGVCPVYSYLVMNTIRVPSRALIHYTL